jgi:integrase
VHERNDTTRLAMAAGSNGNRRDGGPRAGSGMAPRATGAIETHHWRDGRTVTVRARLRAYGRRYRIDFGTNHEGWSVERARVELDRILQQVERGTWEPPSRAGESAAALEGDETVHVTASRWWQRRNAELAPKTRLDYRWRLDHVLRVLAHETTAELDIHRVDTFRGELEAADLSPRSVNMVLDLLAQILDDAVEYGLLSANPARGKRRRMKVPKPTRSFLEPDMVVDLLDAAEEWERGLPRHQRYGRRAFLATLCVAGPRISELTQTPVGRLDLHEGGLQLGLKTAAGIDRHLELSAFLVAELRAHMESLPVALRDREGAALPLFPTRTAGRLNASNIRNRLLNGTPARGGKPGVKGVVERANERRAAAGRLLLPTTVTPHTLRRTFASLCFFAGRDLRWVMGQLGHSDPRMTLAIYAQCMKRKRIDHELVWTLMRFPDEPEEGNLAGRR